MHTALVDLDRLMESEDEDARRKKTWRGPTSYVRKLNASNKFLRNTVE